jgi:hypothetical protein
VLPGNRSGDRSGNLLAVSHICGDVGEALDAGAGGDRYWQVETEDVGAGCGQGSSSRRAQT